MNPKSISDCLAILGCGGHGRSAADVALTSGYSSIVFIDTNAVDGETIMGFKVLRDIESIPLAAADFFPAASSAVDRSQQYELICASGRTPATLTSPFAHVAHNSIVEPGCFVGHHVHIGPNSHVERGCIVNNGAIVEHDCHVEEFCHISVRTCVAGFCKIGKRCWIGAGATVADRITIADDAIVGGGAYVNRSISCAGTYIGVPAKAAPKRDRETPPECL